MLLAVFSDSHGRFDNMRRAVETRRPDHIVFLGDGLRDAERLGREFPQIPLLLLRGNCDWNAAAEKVQESALFKLEGVRIFAAHGHRHGVKSGLEGFANSVHCSGAPLGLYGHTHIPRITETHGLTLMNPGSVGTYGTYGLVWLENGAFRCELATDLGVDEA